MPDLYFFNDDAPSLTVTLDSGTVCAGVRTTHKGRNAFRVTLPDSATGGIVVDTTGYNWTSSQRGLLALPSATNPEFTFALDDIRGSLASTEPDEPEYPQPPMTDPSEVVKWVYSSGAYGEFDLNTKQGCGEYTEACVTCLNTWVSGSFGHIKKTGGQNQWNGHAVDALMNLAGDGCGIWDIIHDSEAPGAVPSYNYKGTPEPELWYFPTDPPTP